MHAAKLNKLKVTRVRQDPTRRGNPIGKGDWNPRMWKGSYKLSMWNGTLGPCGHEAVCREVPSGGEQMFHSRILSSLLISAAHHEMLDGPGPWGGFWTTPDTRDWRKWRLCVCTCVSEQCLIREGACAKTSYRCIVIMCRQLCRDHETLLIKSREGYLRPPPRDSWDVGYANAAQ